MDTILQNRIIITNDDGEPREYFFEKPLDEPVANSDQPVASKYLYQLERKLVHFLGRAVTNKVQAGNVNLPTSSAVFDKIAEVTKINPATVPDRCSFVYYNRDTGKLCYYDTNDVLHDLSITPSQGGASISYDASTHSVVFGGSENTGISEVTP